MIRYWIEKFGCAFRGIWIALRTDSSFSIHVPVAIAVVILGVLMRVSLADWYALVIAIGLVFAMELINTSVEILARKVTKEPSPEIRDALDVAAGAVLFATLGAIAIGVIVFGKILLTWLYSSSSLETS